MTSSENRISQESSFFQLSPDFLAILDLQGHFLQVNPAYETRLGYPHDSLIGKPYNSVVHADDLTLLKDAIGQLKHSGTVHGVEVRGYDAAGDLRWFDVSAQLSAGDLIYLVSRDITDRMKLAQKNQLLERSVDASVNGVVIVDAIAPDQPITYVNPAFEQMTGYTSQEAVGQNCRFLQGPHTSQASRTILREATQQGHDAYVVIGNYRKDGSLFWNELNISPVRDTQGVLTHFIGIQNDISSLHDTQEQLAWISHHDALTRLPSRALFMDRLQQALTLPPTNDQLLAVMAIDLDQYRDLNEFIGNENADDILLEIVRRLQSRLHPSDTLARINSDEFALLLPRRSRADIDQLAQEVQSVIKQPVAVGQDSYQVTASVGLFTLSQTAIEVEELMRLVSVAKLHAKRNGRNQLVEYHSGLDKQMMKRDELRRGMQQALTDNQFRLVYQPQINARNGQILGAEVLMRWLHPESGWVSPSEFIPLAESTGLIGPMTEWLIRQLTVEIKDLLPHVGQQFRFSINVSPMLLLESELANSLVSALQNSGIGPDRLELELTESVLLNASERLSTLLDELRSAGFRIAIDDFGTGFTGLTYLKDFPIDTLKIDRTFVRNIVLDDRDSAIVDSVMHLARHMNLTVVAEGVEDAAQVQHLARSGVDVFQGFFFAKPMNQQDLIRFIADQSPIPGYVPMPGAAVAAEKPGNHLLVIEEDCAARSALGRLFNQRYHSVNLVNSYDDGLNALVLSEPQVLLCNLVSQKGCSLAFLNTIKHRHPQTRVIGLSCSESVKHMSDAVNTGALHRYIVKPWEDNRLLAYVDNAFSESRPRLSTH